MPEDRYDSQIAEIDAFLAEAKRLDGGAPPWLASTRKGELNATWSVVDSIGLIKAELRFRCPRVARNYPSVSLIFRKAPVWRLDLCAPNECKVNLPQAYLLGLPPRVCGSHAHQWPDNKEFIRINGFGHLPMRRSLAQQIRRMPHILAVLADAVNLDLGAEGRGFDVPARDDLFQSPDEL